MRPVTQYFRGLKGILRLSFALTVAVPAAIATTIINDKSLVGMEVSRLDLDVMIFDLICEPGLRNPIQVIKNTASAALKPGDEIRVCGVSDTSNGHFRQTIVPMRALLEAPGFLAMVAGYVLTFALLFTAEHPAYQAARDSYVNNCKRLQPLLRSGSLTRRINTRIVLVTRALRACCGILRDSDGSFLFWQRPKM